MTNPYRAMCDELVEELEDWIVCDDESEIADALSLIDRARTLLAQPEPPELTDEELLRTYGKAKRDHCYEGELDDWPKKAERAASVAGLRAAIAADRARWGRPTPQPPADGEVAEMVRYGIAWNASLASPPLVPMEDGYWTPWHVAAELLQRQHPQPVPLAERPWERDGWCDSEGRCWCFVDHDRQWTLRKPEPWVYDTYCLPFHALPVPITKEFTS